MVRFSFLRSLLLIFGAAKLLSPFLLRGRKQKFSFLLKEGALLLLANWALVSQLAEKRGWNLEKLKMILQAKSK